MSWLSKTFKKVTSKLPSIVTGGLLGGPLGAVAGATGVLDKAQALLTGDDSASRNAALYGATADQFYNNSLDSQARALDLADQRFDAEGQQLDIMEQKANTIYDPMEAELAASLMGDGNVEGAATTARGEFTTNFDQATAQAQRQMRQAGLRPNATMDARLGRQSAYDRARGAAATANSARTAEADQHFLRKSTFFAQNGSGIRERLRAGMQDRYGAYQTAQADARNFSQSQGDRYQGYSNQQASQSGNGLSALLGIGGTVLGGFLGGPAGAVAGAQVGGALGGGLGTNGTAAANPSRPTSTGLNLN